MTTDLVTSKNVSCPWVSAALFVFEVFGEQGATAPPDGEPNWHPRGGRRGGGTDADAALHVAAPAGSPRRARCGDVDALQRVLVLRPACGRGPQVDSQHGFLRESATITTGIQSVASVCKASGDETTQQCVCADIYLGRKLSSFIVYLFTRYF